jgi:hypothetical protein
MAGARVLRIVSSHAPTIIPLLVVASLNWLLGGALLLEREGHHTVVGCCQPQLVARGAWLLEREGHHTVVGCCQPQLVAARGAWLLEREGHHTVVGCCQPQLVARGAWLLEREGHHTVVGCCQPQRVADFQSPYGMTSLTNIGTRG